MAIACVEIDGGAVELSWSIRDFDGCPASCDLRGRDAECRSRTDYADLGQVRICWEAVGDGGALMRDCGRDPTTFSVFSCEEVHGVTGFEIDEGETAIWIEPLCEATGQPPSEEDYDVPAPIVRNITSGSVSTLNALLIVVNPQACMP